MFKYTKSVLSLVIVTLLISAGCTSFNTISTTNELCPKHGTPLATKMAYRITDDVHFTPIREYTRIADDYPKHTPFFYSDKRTAIHRIRESVSYCPKCDKELKATAEKNRKAEQAASSNH
jgi:hypothetical protein